MSKPLVVVESPTKVRTIQKYIGKDYNIVSTIGHIKDLPAKKIGINIEEGFQPEYVNIPGKQKVITNLKKEAGDSTDIYLAADPDREGEAIAWHTADILKKKGRNFHRVLFHELTKNAIIAAIASPERLNESKYEAQQARRILDRLVGYQVSPLLWRKVKSGLSAGRVQSVALRIICERERAIQAFVSEEYWSITAHLETNEKSAFTAKLIKKNGDKIVIPDEETSSQIINELSNTPFTVQKVQKKATVRNPLPPFITSKLQQEAITKLKFSAKKTMIVAQQLYEGIDLGPGETVGLITYMRTDSTRISKESAEEALSMIRATFGEKYALKEPRFFKNTKKVQDAHEAIRPSSVNNTPEKVAPYLSKDQLELYTLIWKRFVASQMTQAIIDKVTVSISAGPYVFNANGSSIKFPGFMSLYMSADDEMEDGKKKMLPDISEGMILNLNKLEPKQHFTQPPPRFSEASLVKELEENGIGRPSTYAAILSTIREKGYVDFLKGYFRPSELGFIVNDLLVQSFPNIFNVDFTAKMEDELDRIEADGAKALDVLTSFYTPFKSELDKASEEMLSVKGVGFPTGIECPECGNELKIKVGKNGHFLACSAYPKCTYSRNYNRDEKGVISPVQASESEATDLVCEKCQKPMVLKHGKYGDFYACSGYPECKNTQSTSSNGRINNTGIKCPEKNCNGEIVEKKSKRGKIFYGCSRYPECTFATWDKPIAKNCPLCKAVFLLEKTTKKNGTVLYCMAEDCGYKESI
ncbi:type I DNA topoisomerase [Desulfobacterium sp. N47]|uniref:DNA topoisomerase 1 n=1 Tax=uncultured Desulfobacterium sp. TaxID=201089 RepID=E1YHR2_9BACT|nr:DNA topoisomerase 1 [uncultured Desulfobacterium sp.]